MGEKVFRYSSRKPMFFMELLGKVSILILKMIWCLRVRVLLTMNSRLGVRKVRWVLYTMLVVKVQLRKIVYKVSNHRVTILIYYGLMSWKLSWHR